MIITQNPKNIILQAWLKCVIAVAWLLLGIGQHAVCVCVVEREREGVTAAVQTPRH